MYLKRLTVAGFKSFADPIEFHFHPGTTAIVGPNGCGKSNVVDAFRWVLGERSAKELRGSEMLDVIFKGTSRREPLGRAEVSLLFDNEDGTLPIDFSEVEISRRLFRSGESEYLINGTKCRLKDILALFADTGIGTEGYSVMEQGNLDAFLNSSAQDRRKIFEEAAGVSRYKKQKVQALRRLERAERDLDRSQDRFREVESRIRSLKIQATKARRFVEDRDRLIQVKAVLANEEQRALVAERELLTFDLFWTQLQRSLLTRLDDGTESHREESREAAEAAAARVTELRREELEFRVELEGIEQRLEGIAARRLEISDARERREEQSEELRRSEEDYAAQRNRIRAQVLESIRSLRTSREESEEAETRHRDFEARRRALEESVHAAKDEALGCVYRATQLSNERTALESEQRSVRSLRERRAREAQEFREELEETSRVRTELEARREAARSDAEESGRRAKELEREVRSRTELLDENRQRLATLRGEYEEAQARLRFLRELEERREGIGEGARRLLASEAAIGGDVLGLLAGGLEVDPEHALAVDAALGVHGETVVLSGEIPPGDRCRAIAREVDGRDVAFIQVDGLSDAPGTERELPEGCRPLLDVVRIEPRHRGVIGALLLDVILCPGLPEAVALQATPGLEVRCVLADGTVLEPWGALRMPAKEGRGLVSRRIEIAGLESRTEVLGAELGEAREKGTELEGTIQERQAEMRGSQEAAQRHELDVEHCDRLLSENEEERSRLIDRSEVVETELEDLAEQLVRLEADLAERVSRFNEVERERVALEAKVAKAEEERAPLDAALTELEGLCSRLRVETTQTEERLVARRREQMRVQSELEERGARRRRLEEDSRQDDERWERLDGEEQRDRDRGTEVSGGLEALAERVTEAEDENAAAKARLREAEGLLGRLRREGERLREHREGKLLADNERRVRIENIRTKLQEELDGDVTELPIDTWRGELLEEYGSEVGEQGLLARLRSEQEELSRRLRKNSNVNLQAVEELGTEEDRRDHLGSQITDLEEARTTLLESIETLNEKSRDLFLSTFEAVRRNFQDLFRTVFNGGNADLILEEGVDPLEAGVEVKAQPPGKKITSLRALSGGEKALTAVSVLFALFRSKPSPFCILDEVDAPLDESNIRRFVRVLQQFSDQSQFLIITHSRVTMGEAERLYGVTMEEEGVSRKVAVTVDKGIGEEAAGDGSVHADALLPPPRLGSDDHLPTPGGAAEPSVEAEGASLEASLEEAGPA